MKDSEILFFPHQTMFPGPTPISKWQTDAERNDKLLNTSKNRSFEQKSSKYSVFLY